jgi:hypothetical protein
VEGWVVVLVLMGGLHIVSYRALFGAGNGKHRTGTTDAVGALWQFSADGCADGRRQVEPRTSFIARIGKLY